MAILSDLFNEVDLYSNVYTILKKFLDQKPINHSLNGYAIYTVLKCLAVVDLVCSIYCWDYCFNFPVFRINLVQDPIE